MIDNEKVHTAAMLYLLSPCRGSEKFREVDMMLLAGIPAEFADTSVYLAAFTNEYTSLENQFGKSKRQNDGKKVVAHFREVDKLIPTATIPTILRLIGLRQEELFRSGLNKGGSNIYMNCRNARIRALKKKSPEIIVPPPTESINVDVLSPLSETSELTDESSSSDVSTILELSQGQPNYNQHISFSSSSTSSSPPSSTSTSQSTSTSTSSSSDDDLPRLVLDSLRGEKDIAPYFTKTSHRRSADEAHELRQWEQCIRDVKVAAYKVATTLYSTVDAGRNQLERFKDATACAKSVNKLFGFSNLVSGHQLSTSIKNGLVGKTPPRTGNPGLVPHSDVKDLAELVYTLEAIEQNNAGKRTDRAALVTLVESIVNEKLSKEGKCIVDAWQFFNRIQNLNAPKQNTCVVNEREARRVLWMTIQNARAHYIQWEEFLVKNGFARVPNSIKEKHEKGYVVWHPDQLHRLIIFDECQMSLDGSSDENAGGRRSITHTTPALNEAGCSANKSGDAVTLMLCAIGLEMLPPLVIYPSNAASKKNFKIPIENIKSFHQVRAQYGLEVARWHDPMFAISRKGGMNKEIFNDFINNHVLNKIPDRSDLPGKRVVMKADMGPGRTSIEFLARAKITGSHFFPGMPNSTEAMQEMDQVFGVFKSALYKNRSDLYQARLINEGLTSNLTHADIGYLIFGGKIPITSADPSKPPAFVELPNAFVNSLSKDHLERAYKKCGYYPATRAPMRSPKMRYEIVECGLDVDPNSDLDLAEEATMLLLESFEDLNHSAVNRLMDKGYSLASRGRRFVARVTTEQFQAREAIQTEPNTRERQEALANARYSGDFFRIDGGVMTSSDYLIGKERKQMKAHAIAMEKKKKRYQSAASIEQQYKELISSDKIKWNKDETVLAIHRHHGVDNPPKGETNFRAMAAAKVKAIYDRNYRDKKPPPIPQWTPQMELKLGRFQRGEIDSFQETICYGKAVKENEDYIVKRLQAVSESTRNKALLRLSETLDAECRDRLVKSLQGLSTVPFEYGDSDDEDVYESNENEDLQDDSMAVDDSMAIDDSILLDLPPIAEVDSDAGTSSSSDSDDTSEGEIQPRYGLRSKKTATVELDSVELDSISLEAKREALIDKQHDSLIELGIETELDDYKEELEAGKDRIAQGKKPLKKQVFALILSKGESPYIKASKAELDAHWDKVKGKDDWKRTIWFTPADAEELDSIGKKLRNLKQSEPEPEPQK